MKKYTISTRTNPELAAYLDQQGIPYKDFAAWLEQYGVPPKDSHQILYFDITDKTKKEREVIEYVQAHFSVIPIVTGTYTPKEMAAAKLIALWPRSFRIDIINWEESYRYSCPGENMAGNKLYEHREQIDTFAIRRLPPLGGKTAFWTEDIGGGVIFTDSRVRELALDHQLKGIEFRDVLVKKQPSEKIFQLDTDHVLEKWRVELGHGEEVYRCPQCGKEQLSIHSEYQVHMNLSGLDLQYDLYKTEWLFGDGQAHCKYLISQRFYQLLRENKLTFYTELIPVAEVE